MFGDRREVISKKEARDQLKQGINTLADTVACTMGPKGRHVIVQRIYNDSRVTKDGVTVASEFFLNDPVQDIGAQLIKKVAVKTAEDAGDGTTTATVLSRAIINEGLNYVNSDKQHNPVDVNKGIDIAVEKIVTNLKKMSIPVDINTKELEHVATISTNNDEELGAIVAEAVSSVGKEGKVVMEYSKDHKTYTEVIKGTVSDQGFISPEFITDANKEEVVLNKPLILVSNFKFLAIEHIEPFFKYAYDNKRDMLIIAEELEKQALGYALGNLARGVVNIAIVRPPSVSNMRSFMLGDIATITGGSYRNRMSNHLPEKFLTKYYGEADKVIVNRKNTIILGGKGDEEEKKERIESIRENIKNADKGVDDRHRDRLSKMFSGVATVYIGANSELEREEKKYRVEDAILATQSALEEGIVPGGGMALIESINWDPLNQDLLEGDIDAGYTIALAACMKPFMQILSNAGKDGEAILKEIKSRPSGTGYNVKTGEYVPDLIKEGVIDPTKVVRVALENAASVAKMILTTEAVIYYGEDNHLAESIKPDPGNVR